ncbi:hypothetical protein JXA85_08745 [Candidatus Woesearchaeota archaeon]|nr:hypothetical protein [Candidatus Woesearchaeota archaeon]
MKKRSQTISTDVVVAIVLFMIAFVFFFQIISKQSTSSASLRRESEMLPVRLTNPGPDRPAAFIVENKVDKSRLKEVAGKNYSELKEELNLKHEFCLYFEDEQGNLIDISKDTGRSCIGSSAASLNGVPCG